VGFENPTKYFFIIVCLIWFGHLIHILETDAQTDFFMYIAVWLFITIKSEQDSDLNILTGIYFWIRSLRYSDENMKLDLVQWSQTYRKPVQLEQNWCFMFLFASACHLRRAPQSCTQCRRFVRERGDII